jgi:hypothetical protein
MTYLKFQLTAVLAPSLYIDALVFCQKAVNSIPFYSVFVQYGEFLESTNDQKPQFY